MQLTVPLHADGEDIGTLTLLRDGHEPFAEADRRLVARAADLVARKALEAHRLDAVRDVRVDTATGLPNACGLQEVGERELERSRREAIPLSVLYVDVEGMGAINDTFGLAVGDRVLRAVAHTLRDSVRPYDTCARIGGDEFALLFPRCPADVASSRARHLAEKISDLDIHTAQGPVRVRIDATTVTYPADGETLPALLQRARADLQQVVVAPAHGGPLTIVPGHAGAGYDGTVAARDAAPDRMRTAGGSA